MPYKRQTPEQIAFARSKQREYNARYRLSVRGKTVHSEGQARYREAHKEELDATRRSPCVVCGGPKEPGRGFRKCNACWGVRPEKSLEELIAEQAADMALDRIALVPPQRFGDTNASDSSTVSIDSTRFNPTKFENWEVNRMDAETDPWSDPTADEALNGDI